METAVTVRPPWYVRAFFALVSAEPLPPDRCLQILAGLSAVMALAGPLTFALGQAAHGAARSMALFQGIAGFTGLVGSVAAWRRPRVLPLFLLVAGAVLAAMIVGYSFFLLHVLAAPRESGFVRVTHAPGALAVSTAFAARLFLDSGFLEEAIRRRLARKVGFAGLLIGGALDILILIKMATSVGQHGGAA